MLLKSWHLLDVTGKKCEVEFISGQLIIRRESEKMAWTIPQLFSSYAPLSFLSLHDQNDLLSFLANVPLEDDFNGVAALNHEMWKHTDHIVLQPATYSYETKISHVSKWKLEVTGAGLAYYDLLFHYGHKPGPSYQTLNDFWFFGPLYPIPDRELRQKLITHLAVAFRETGFEAVDSHFDIIDYPQFISPPMWTEGNHIASDFIIVRNYGVEYGRENFHDGLVSLGYVSFEHCLTRNDIPSWMLTPEIQAEIKSYF